MNDEAKRLVDALREHAEWAHANEWETPITLGTWRRPLFHDEARARRYAAWLNQKNGLNMDSADFQVGRKDGASDGRGQAD